jgi:hypothetical protein
MDEQDIFAAVSKDPAVLARLYRAAHRMRHEQGHLWEPVPGCGCEEWIDRLLAEYDDEARADSLDDLPPKVLHALVMSDDDREWPEDLCDDCGRTDGTHDDEVEH